MTQENHVDEEQGPQQNASDADMRASAVIPPISAESGIIISNQQVQSIDISDRFTRHKTPDGWQIKLQQPCKVTVNLVTSMRKIEVALIEGDIIEKDASDLIVLRKHPIDTYKRQRSGSSLARSREELLQGSTPEV